MRPTKTNSTVEQYKNRFTLLNRQYDEEHGFDWSADPIKFATWCYQEAVNRKLKKSTWRQYRAALIWHFETCGPIEAKKHILDLGQVPAWHDSPDRTSSMRMKRQDLEDIQKIMEHLRPRKGTHDQLLVLWLFSSRITGLRPVEWAMASIEKNTLVVKNAKNTNSRGLGETRRLSLSLLPEKEQRIVKSFVEYYHRQADNYGYDKLYTYVRQRLWRLNKKIWPKRKKHLTLYSGRHELSRNLKSAGLPQNEIAAAFGHKSQETVQNNYARRPRSGNYKPYAAITPDPEDVSKVQGQPRQKPSFSS